MGGYGRSCGIAGSGGAVVGRVWRSGGVSGWYGSACGAGQCGPVSMQLPSWTGHGARLSVPYGNVPSYLSGVTVPQYGMPITGTPIGLPGPPHIPLGTPPDLKKHVMTNHTHNSNAGTGHKFKINVRQQPGYSYPAPPTRMRVREQSIHPPIRYGQTIHDANQCVQ